MENFLTCIWSYSSSSLTSPYPPTTMLPTFPLKFIKFNYFLLCGSTILGIGHYLDYVAYIPRVTTLKKLNSLPTMFFSLPCQHISNNSSSWARDRNSCPTSLLPCLKFVWLKVLQVLMSPVTAPVSNYVICPITVEKHCFPLCLLNRFLSLDGRDMM